MKVECVDEVPLWESKKTKSESKKSQKWKLNVLMKLLIEKSRTDLAEKKVKIWQRKAKIKSLVKKLENYLAKKEKNLTHRNGQKREGHDVWTNMGWNWEFQFESWNVVLGKTQKFWFFNPFATHLSPDAKVGIQMKIGVEKQNI